MNAAHEKMDVVTENTVIQIRTAKNRGEWMDYSRTTRPAAALFVAASPETYRMLDWISGEVLDVCGVCGNIRPVAEYCFEQPQEDGDPGSYAVCGKCS